MSIRDQKKKYFVKKININKLSSATTSCDINLHEITDLDQNEQKKDKIQDQKK